MEIDELYTVKEYRDMRAKELRAEGYTVKRSSVRNQIIHPMYIEDRKHVVKPEDKSFGNNIYRTFYAVLYQLEASLPNI